MWSTRHANEKVVFKLLLNDQVWAKGEDVVVDAGRKIEAVPFFWSAAPEATLRLASGYPQAIW